MSARKLRGIDPVEVKSRFKALFWGDAFTGKTTCAMGFPKPYYIECEGRGDKGQYVKLLKENGGSFFRTQSFEEMFDEVRTLATVEHPYKTLIIDPITYIYGNLIKSCGKKYTEAHGKHYVKAYEIMKEFLDFVLYKLDMNVVVTAHAKKDYNDKEEYVGDTYDGYKKLHFAFDIVIQTARKNGIYVGIVNKECLGILKADTEIKNFSYKTLEKFYGEEFMNQECVTIVPDMRTGEIHSVVKALPIQLISQEIIDNIEDFMNSMSMDEVELNQWLSALKGTTVKIELSKIKEMTMAKGKRLLDLLAYKFVEELDQKNQQEQQSTDE